MTAHSVGPAIDEGPQPGAAWRCPFVGVKQT
jgi:hypothetical protein